MRVCTLQTGVNILGMPTYVTHVVTQSKSKQGVTVQTAEYKHTNI